jgi:hypothetical protein
LDWIAPCDFSRDIFGKIVRSSPFQAFDEENSVNEIYSWPTLSTYRSIYEKVSTSGNFPTKSGLCDSNLFQKCQFVFKSVCWEVCAMGSEPAVKGTGEQSNFVPSTIPIERKGGAEWPDL